MQKLPSLQVLRAIAALGVAASHIWGNAVFHLTAGVDLFFVISGFVMVYSSEPLFGKFSGIADFAWRRVTRIVPLYWTTVAAFLYFGFPATGAEILKTLFFIPYQNPVSGHWQPIGYVGWTLNFEMFFYAIFTCAVILPRRAAVLVTVLALTAIVGIGLITSLPGPLAYYANPIVIEFAFGCIVGLAYSEGIRLPRPVAVIFIIMAVATLTYCEAPLDLPRPFIWGLPSAAIVAAACLVEKPWTMGDIGKPFSFLGDASYALYLIHMQLYGFLLLWGFPKTGSLLILVASAIFVHILYEKPLLRLFINWPLLFRRRAKIGDNSVNPRQNRIGLLEGKRGLQESPANVHQIVK